MESDKDVLLKEIQANFSKADYDAYKSIRESYLLILHGPYDYIREEICCCIIFRLFQASITLTNHLLELLLKNSLIVNEIGSAQVSLADVNTIHAAAVAKFDNLELSNTINRACSKGIITKPEKLMLSEYREDCRNAYSHAQKKKLFKGETFNGIMGKLDGSSFSELTTVEVANFLPLQGEAQKRNASEQAIPYFKFVDEILVRIEKQHHPQIDEMPELYTRQFNF